MRRKKTPGRGRRAAGVSKTERRQQILISARDVFAKRGYHQAAVKDIVAAAGVAHGTFYLYFEDKRAVLTELLNSFWLRIGAAIPTIETDNPERSVSEQIRQNILAILKVCLGERAMTKILLTDAVGLDQEFDLKLRSFYEEVAQLLIQTLTEGQSLGIVVEGEPRVLAYLTVGAIKELLYQAVTLGLTEPSADALADQMFIFLRDGLLRQEERPPAKRRKRAR